MKFAYLIMAHHEFSILKKLVELIDDDRNDIYLHIDQKAKEVPSEITTGSVIKKSSLHIIPSREITWGGFSIIKCEMELLSAALNSGKNYDYYHLMSGVDLPLHDQNYIHHFFESNKGKEFIGKNDKWGQKKDIQYRYQIYHLLQDKVGRKKTFLYFLNKLIMKVQIPIIHRNNEIMSGGSEWFSITNEFAQFIISQKEWIYKTFKYTLCGDEHFIQTILLNSIYKEKQYLPDSDMYKQCVRYIDFSVPGDLPGSPKTLDIKDAVSLLHNKDYIFARKFSETDTERRHAVDYIYEELSHHTTDY